MAKVTLNNVEKLDTKMNEAYKQLRTNLIFCGDDVKTVVVTSCRENEGKSEVSFNMACSLAEAGNRVVLIDCDIRHSVLLNRYQVDEKVNGLSHFLAGRIGLDDIVCQTNIRNMFMIFAGANVPNPAELLGNKRFRMLIDSMRKLFDYVILDCPPLGIVIDAAIVAKYADGAVLIIESNAISYKVTQSVKSQLAKSGCRILGVVINKAERMSKGRYGNYYGGYYGGYYSDDSDKDTDGN